MPSATDVEIRFDLLCESARKHFGELRQTKSEQIKMQKQNELVSLDKNWLI